MRILRDGGCWQQKPSRAIERSTVQFGRNEPIGEGSIREVRDAI